MLQRGLLILTHALATINQRFTIVNGKVYRSSMLVV